MIRIQNDNLRFEFPRVHEDAVLRISFQRTLRIPDNDQVHYLPPGLGRFPLRNIDQYRAAIPEAWIQQGGVMMPMFQSEAMWFSFSSDDGFPFLLMISAGGVNAVTGDPHDGRPVADPQNYLVVPEQPWLDGFCVARGEIRQFVAAPLGEGYTAEEQLTGQAQHGGVQFTVVPMKRERWLEILKKRSSRVREETMFCMDLCTNKSMGLGAGGRMRQEIYDDPHGFDVWDLDARSHCFLHIANSLTWRAITGEAPPTIPPTAKQYTEYGMPWFDWYDAELTALEGADKLKGLKSVAQIDSELDAEKPKKLLPENEPVGPVKPVVLKGDVVRETSF